MGKKLKIFSGIGELLTLSGAFDKGARRCGEADLSIISDAVMVTEEGVIRWVGPRSSFDARKFESPAETLDLGGRTVIPGFVECHTHLVFAGDRSHEFEWRMQGETYQQIAAKGGGILSTVKETRKASEADLLKLAQKRADKFLAQGVTTLEVKSGYGLSPESEIKSLKVARSIQGPRVITTYLGAHSRSPDFADLDAYMEQMVGETLPQIAREKLADRVDIYIEKGFYSLEHGRRYFEKARELGLPVTAHVEQLSEFGGARLALDFNPQSVDHVVYASDEDIARLARMDTVAVLLPASDLYLKMAYPRARRMIDSGVRVAVSTDFNPGTSPTQDLSLVGLLSRLEMKMTLPETLVAFTLGGAFALGLGHEVGSLTEGKRADFCVLDGRWRELFFSVGHHPVAQVFISGEKK